MLGSGGWPFATGLGAVAGLAGTVDAGLELGAGFACVARAGAVWLAETDRDVVGAGADGMRVVAAAGSWAAYV